MVFAFVQEEFRRIAGQQAYFYHPIISDKERSTTNMFTGAYICASSVVFLLGLAFLVFITKNIQRGHHEGVFVKRYSLFSILLTGLTLMLFTGLSASMGLMGFSETQDWGYPGDYLAYGPAGWFLAFLPVFGVLSPLLALLIILIYSRSRKQSMNGFNL
jgi:hypothetical protein